MAQDRRCRRLVAHVSRAACHAAQQALSRLTAAVLSNPKTVPRLAASSKEELAALGVMAFRSGVGPLAGWWLAHGMIEAALIRLLDCLEAVAVPATLLKGAHTAHGYFPAPETRPAADIDLLVEPASFPAAAVALNAGGYLEVLRSRRPARSEWIEQGRPQVVRSLDVEHPENPWRIDLHQSLERRYFRGARAEFAPNLWRTTWLEVSGRRVGGLAQPLLLAFLALHASYGVLSIRLLQLVELVLVIRRDLANGTLVCEDLGELVGAARVERFVYPALELAERLVPGTVSPGLRARLAAATTPRMQRVVDRVWAAGVQAPLRSLEGRLMWAKGPLETLTAIGEMLWPTDDAVTLRRMGHRVSPIFS